MGDARQRIDSASSVHRGGDRRVWVVAVRMTFWEWHDSQPRWVRVAIPTIGFVLIVVLGIWFFSTVQVFVAY